MNRPSDIPLIAPGIVRMPKRPGESPQLLGGYCPACKAYLFPKPPMCPDCFGEVDEADLGSDAIIYSFTVIHTKPPLGLPQPYAVGYVDMRKTGLRLFCLLDPDRIGDLRIGGAVKLSVAHLGHDGHGEPRLRPYFTPLDGGGKG